MKQENVRPDRDLILALTAGEENGGADDRLICEIRTVDLHCKSTPSDLLMRSKIVRIGNSQGVRLPKLMIEQAGLTEEVELRVEAGQIVIEAPRKARAGWAEAAQRAHAAGHDRLESTGATQFDQTEWEWQ